MLKRVIVIMVVLILSFGSSVYAATYEKNILEKKMINTSSEFALTELTDGDLNTSKTFSLGYSNRRLYLYNARLRESIVITGIKVYFETLPISYSLDYINSNNESESLSLSEYPNGELIRFDEPIEVKNLNLHLKGGTSILNEVELYGLVDTVGSGEVDMSIVENRLEFIITLIIFGLTIYLYSIVRRSD